jgi:hypothetical protein
MCGICFDPFEDLSISLSGNELLSQQLRVETSKVEKVLIQGTCIVVFAILFGDACAPFVQHARQLDITTEAHPGTSGWPQSKVGGHHAVGIFWLLRIVHLYLLIFGCKERNAPS